mgnify:CR=1 FL=1
MREIFSLIVSFILTHFSFAQKQSLLWQVSGNGLSKPSYIYGTIHMICKEDMNLSPVLKQKFAETEKVYLELDIDDKEMMASMQKLSLLPPDKTLKSFFTSREYARVNQFFNDEVGVSLTLFEKMKPIVLMSVLYTKCLPCIVPASFEMRFVEMAKAKQKEVEGLETAQEQMMLFDNLPDDAQKKMVLSVIDSFATAKKNANHLVTLYTKQQLDKLYERTVNSPDMAGSKEALVDNRNKKWIPILEKNMHSKICFIAVGAGHLGGETGILNLLKKKGYAVEPVMN